MAKLALKQIGSITSAEITLIHLEPAHPLSERFNSGRKGADENALFRDPIFLANLVSRCGLLLHGQGHRGFSSVASTHSSGWSSRPMTYCVTLFRSSLQNSTAHFVRRYLSALFVVNSYSADLGPASGREGQLEALPTDALPRKLDPRIEPFSNRESCAQCRGAWKAERRSRR